MIPAQGPGGPHDQLHTAEPRCIVALELSRARWLVGALFRSCRRCGAILDQSLKTDTTIAALPLETKLADNATDLCQARAR
jgi:hypothetical protein